MKKIKFLSAITCFTFTILFSQGSVKGKITDETGVAISGANIYIKSSDIGSISDSDGNYTLNSVPQGESVLVVDFIGYERSENILTISSDETITINIALTTSVLSGQEVLVVGYGTQQRREVTGSISRISDLALREARTLGFEEALQGNVSGVDVQEYSGEPGAAPNIRIRGAGSISAGNEPLYVVDGFPISKDLGLQGTLFRRRTAFKPPSSNPLAVINPDDIESIEILKDASAASIYGSRGANGVVIITTKRGGKTGVPVIKFSSYSGSQTVSNKPSMMNSEEIIAYAKDARNNNYLQTYDPTNSASTNYNPNYNPNNNTGRPSSGSVRIPEKYVSWDGTDTDWLDLIFRSAPVSNNTFSISNGSENFGYAISGGYFDQSGLIKNSNFKRYTASARIDGKFKERLAYGLNLNTVYTKNNRVPANAPYFGRPPGIVYSAMVHSPVIKPYNSDGTINQLDGQSYMGNGNTSASNPLAIIEGIKEELNNHRSYGNIFADINIIPGLTFRSSAGLDLNNYMGSFYRSNSLLYRTSKTGDPYAQSSSGSSYNWLWENTVNYKTSFSNVHNLSMLAGYTAQKEAVEMNSVVARSFPDDQVSTISGGAVTEGSGTKEEWSLASMLARLNYNYDYRYLLTLAVRSDRSSRFGKNNQTGVFPSFSAAWRIHEESFMKSLETVSELKIRASYGVTGNFQIPNYGAIGLLGQGLYPDGNNTNPAIYPQTFSNADLGWETTKQTNFGADFALFEDRIYGSFDTYNSDTEDLLLFVGVPASTGFTTALKNIGKVNNKGFEFNLTSRNLSGELSWSTDFNYSTNKNEVIALGGENEPIYSKGSAGVRHITRVGDAVGSYYGYVVDGVYQNQSEIDSAPTDILAKAPRPGDFRFKDINGDGIINTDDRTITGSYNPDYIWGITNRLKYKNFDLSVFFQGVEGREILNLTARHMKNGEANFNSYDVLKNRWISESEPGDGKTPRADRSTGTHGNNNRPSSYQVEDGSYARLKNLTIGYTLPRSMSEKYAEDIRLYFTAKNLATWTDYIGFNPEVSLQSQNMLTQGEDYGAYPLSVSLVFGLNVTF